MGIPPVGHRSPEWIVIFAHDCFVCVIWCGLWSNFFGKRQREESQLPKECCGAGVNEGAGIPVDK